MEEGKVKVGPSSVYPEERGKRRVVAAVGKRPPGQKGLKGRGDLRILEAERGGKREKKSGHRWASGIGQPSLLLLLLLRK